MANGINDRDIVLEILLAVTRDGKNLHVILKDTLDVYAYIDKRDRSFIKRLATGTIERMGQMDFIINQFSSVRTSKMKPVIRNILRMSVYQMLYMDSVPTNAIVNEAVNLAGKRGFKNLKGFVNGVLRNISRNLNEITYPEQQNYGTYMEAVLSIPENIALLLKEQYGEEKAIEIAESFLKERNLTIRVNTLKTTQDDLKIELEDIGVKVDEIEGMKDAFYITEIDNLASINAFNEGKFFVQDISSMNIPLSIHPTSGQKGIDVCAAPGGKSMLAAILMNNEGELISRDVSNNKIQLIEENIERVGTSIIRTEIQDATKLDEEHIKWADFVICDAPCSGLGVISKKPDIKYHLDIKGLDELVNLQAKILDTVQNYVKPGGKMVYSTCTINKKENEQQIRSFLEKHNDYSLVEEKVTLPKETCDGFYYALLARQ